MLQATEVSGDGTTALLPRRIGGPIATGGLARGDGTRAVQRAACDARIEMFCIAQADTSSAMATGFPWTKRIHELVTRKPTYKRMLERNGFSR
ncbi:hypothetical protein XH86_19420 [Bradyrhizobium guangdongense]|uniref:Uncharacterized protein n=1 Tax=Bradyrhizobium guangdongense TaxID=1325090 RepID=A0ABX6UIA7_9BRAD|nr:hypothetical protein X265_19410 [Bradyrhizobium guangdongense]QOZ60648.1 hypothetical protein XH86_19420 [Bradyrhizobium guangdongense]